MTRVSAGTPAGEMLRRYWWPVGVSSDLVDKPKLVRILGEDLVLFRQPDGRCGLVDARCAHRGANLIAGRVDNNGIRCAYHGWQFSCEGHCVEQPAEPDKGRHKDRVRQKAYPIEELGGLVFAYLGPSPRPLLPKYDVLVSEDGARYAGFAKYLDANWLQVVENHQDPTHTSYLHDEVTPWASHPDCRYDDTALGSVSTQVREGPAPDMKYVRRTHFLVPTILKVCLPDPLNEDFSAPSTERLGWVVPVDDTSTIEFEVLFAPNTGAGKPGRFKYKPDAALYRIEVPKPFQEYRYPGQPGVPDYHAGGATGATVVRRQDTLIMQSQGLISDRSLELLGQADQGVAKLRRAISRAIDAVETGSDPMGVIRDPDQNACIDIDAMDKLIPNNDLDRMLTRYA